MKKLALAFLCLVSAAFFTSCVDPVENPEPSIAIKTGENYIFEGQTIDLYKEYCVGFRAASNAQTQKELSSARYTFKVADLAGVVTTLKDTTYTISGNEWEMIDTLFLELERDLIGKGTFSLTVTDVDRNSKSVELSCNINLPATPLISRTFEWYRLGNTQTGLQEYGLKWESNQKATHAQIKPLDGVKLYQFKESDWQATTDNIQKAALFADGGTEITVYNNVSTSAGGTYNDVIGTKMADGTLHLINVTGCVIGEFQPQGYPITIKGTSK